MEHIRILKLQTPAALTSFRTRTPHLPSTPPEHALGSPRCTRTWRAARWRWRLSLPRRYGCGPVALFLLERTRTAQSACVHAWRGKVFEPARTDSSQYQRGR
eukprot:6635944-Prymnesium_polylepis.2